MSVHYKFKSALDFDTITFDGLHISVSDLKKSIIHQKRLGKTADFDLQITNAQTKEEYTDDVTLIPKNTSLIIARIPLAVQPKKPWDPQADKVQGVRQAPEPDSGTLDLSQMNGTEEDKIQAMMIQSTMDYDPNNYQKIRGQGQTGEVPANYRCFKCHKPGHWIKNCPLGSSGESVDVKRNTGIPRSFIERDSQEKGAETQPQPPPPVPEKKQEIPEDLICSICKDLFTDAVMIPCCGSSFCDECVRTALLESEDNECPDCKEKGSSPGSLIPNRFLRNSVNAFKNETGYSKPRQRKELPKAREVPPPPVPTSIASQSEEASSISEPPKESKGKTEEKEKEVTKDKKDAEVVEKKVDPGALSSHDESDFEDNITVTMPPAHLQGPIAFKERQYNGRHGRHPRPPGIENSPKSSSTAHTTPPNERHRSGTPTVDEKEASGDGGEQAQKHHPVPSHHSSSRDRERESMRPHRSTPSDMYNSGPPVGSYQNQPMMGPGRPYDMGVYGVPSGPGYPPYMMNDRMRGPYHPPRPGYSHMHPMRPRHMAPPGTLASVYQGVAAKVGTGIIDDPLEAFNRIMREKEKRKEERRRSPERRRSRSIEMNLGRMRHSPPVYNRGRIRSPEERRLRTPPSRERRGRSREREKRSMEREKHRHRSSSFSDRSSRSRSWSIPPRRRTKSPIVMRKRSRSRSPSFSMSRSRSRSNSQGRFRGPAPPLRYNRSPIRAISPRYRQKENRRPERREEFPREEFRERSPYHYQPRRPRSRGRMMSPGPHRQDRPPVHIQEQFFHQSQMSGMYNEAAYSQNNNRYPRDPPVMLHREPYGRDRNSDYKIERFDDGPQGPDEPPPPGFENSPERVRRNSWNLGQFDDHGYRDDYRNKDAPKKDYMDRAHTPELHEIQSVEREERHRHEMRQREGRSWSRTSRHSSNNIRRRKSRSRSPIRMERIPEHFSGRDRNPSKEKHSNRDRYSAEQAAHIEKERTEHEKRERVERDRKVSDKKHNDRKAHEKENRHTAKEEKEKEKEKHKEQEKEKEKEKRKDSSDEDKRDKKTKEKRKKKKEKDPEKKKKKEKKEKEKKLKEREKEKEETKAKEKEIEEEKEKKKEQVVVREASVDKIKIAPEEKKQDVEEPQPIVEFEKSKPAEDDTPSQEEGEIADDDEDKTSDDKAKEAEVIDLYGDICQEEEIRYEYNHSLSENSESEVKAPKDTNKISPTEIKRFDSVLDIHDFEPDLEDIPKEDKREAGVLVPLPELSKWEREEEAQIREEKRPPSASEPFAISDEKSGKVTTEVIRRAENAIFARAINAIRPIEIKKISVERQKLYSNEPLRELSSPPSVVIKSQSPNQDLPTFQITVPANSNSAERSVEIKSEKQKRTTPVRSVKDRLGSKVTEPPAKRNRSRSNTPPRKIALEGSRVEKIRPPRSKSREHHKAPEDAKDTRRGSEIRRANESTASRNKERNQKDYKLPDNNRSREPSRNERRDTTERRRDHPNERSRDRQYDQDRNREREREKEKEKVKERRRTPERRDKSREGLRDRDRDRERERDRGHERDRNVNRDIERVKDRQPSSNRENRSKERPRSREQERTRSRQDKKERSRTRSSERKEKRGKREKDTKRKRSEDKSQECDKKCKLEKVEPDPKERNIVRKKSLIDEANFVPDYDEQPDQEHSHKTNESSSKKTERPSKEKAKSPESNKRSHSASPSSSSSSSSDSESNSDSEDNKKKKKRKHKKKKSRRASSAESAASTKRKRSKSKKKAKSAKKKKKSKK